MKKALFTEAFDATAPLRVDEVKIEWIVDNDPDLSYLEQDYTDVSKAEAAKCRKQDADRLAAYDAGDWFVRGCRAVATVSYPIGQGSQRLETFTSGGLWGIESDCGAEYEREIESQQTADLREHLAHFGIKLPEAVTA